MKITHNKMISLALFLLGIVMLLEAAATMFVLVEAPQLAGQSSAAAWFYVLLKSLVSLFAIVTGYLTMKK